MLYLFHCMLKRSSNNYQECSLGITLLSAAPLFLAFHCGPPCLLLPSQYFVNSEPNCRLNWLLGMRGGVVKETEGGCLPEPDGLESPPSTCRAWRQESWARF